jgi:hypothetical protein
MGNKKATGHLIFGGCLFPSAMERSPGENSSHG